MSQRLDVIAAAQCIEQGGVIAYPTEAVFGLGCNPNDSSAVKRILDIKSRDESKGLIVVAGELSELSLWVDQKTLATDYPHVLKSWQNRQQSITWLLPCKPETPRWLTGDFDTLAVRISPHPVVQALTRQLGYGVVSTSANHSGEEAPKTAQEVMNYFPDVPILEGNTLQFERASTIKDAYTQQIIR